MNMKNVLEKFRNKLNESELKKNTLETSMSNMSAQIQDISRLKRWSPEEKFTKTCTLRSTAGEVEEF